MNLKRGFKRVTFALAFVSAITFGFLVGRIPYIRVNHWWAKYPDVVKKPSEQELQQFRAWQREMGTSFDDFYMFEEPNAYEGSLPTLMESREHFLKKQKDRYWQGLSKSKLIGGIVLYSLSGFVVGFSGVWLFLWFGGLIVCKIIRWLIHGFCDDEICKKIENVKTE
ncbi:MAG: hypothetical protein JW787_03815 [Sedimentisphaerales bacterium]|nr:hypothetical protein [Sedimentisphaerales bacterium]